MCSVVLTSLPPTPAAAAAAAAAACLRVVESTWRSLCPARRFERDMTTLPAQQDVYFVALAALVNISQLRAAQPLLARKALLVLLGTSTFLYGRVASAT
jgi:hypothetical protein